MAADESRVDAAEKRAGLAELSWVAKAPCRIALGPFLGDFLHRPAGLVRHRLEVGPQTVGVKGAGQQSIDGGFSVRVYVRLN